jgi:Tol biopolymer transport system component
MDDMTPFERSFEDRVRAFAVSGVRPVDAAAVARAVVVGHPRSAAAGLASRRLGLTFDRKAWAIAVAIGLLLTLLGGALLVGARLLLSPLDATPGRLVYALDGDIYVADWDGTHPVRIADGGAAAACGGFRGDVGLVSPDARHIAYRSGWHEECPATVFIMDPDGDLVASFPGSGWAIAWSPDATRIATWLDGEGQRIGVYGIDGTRQAVLDGSRTCCGDYDPSWSPDGASLLIPTHDPAPGTMWELPVDGGTPRRVPDADTRSHRGAVYSDDGARVAFVPWKDSASLVIAEAGGTELRVLPGAKVDLRDGPGEGDYHENPVWSPLGDRVAFSWSRRRPLFEAGDPPWLASELRLVDVATGTVVTLAVAPGNGPIWPLGFSQDGDRILFGQGVGVRTLWSVNVDGSDARMLLAGTDQAEWLAMPGDAEGSATP